MCVAIPAEIMSINGTEAEVNLEGVHRRVSIYLTPEAKVGEYVLLHAGFAIRVVDVQEAKETIDLLRKINEPYR
jgi:hydrogenase expression/formation protein HypC